MRPNCSPLATLVLQKYSKTYTKLRIDKQQRTFENHNEANRPFTVDHVTEPNNSLEISIDPQNLDSIIHTKPMDTNQFISRFINSTL